MPRQRIRTQHRGTVGNGVFYAVCAEVTKRWSSANPVLGNLDKRTPVRDLHLAFKIPYVYDYKTTLCRRQAEVILNHENPNVRATGQGEARHRKHKRLKLGGGQVYDRSSV
jgi:hypothetical protein